MSMTIPPIEMASVSKVSPRSKQASQREPWPKVITLGVQQVEAMNSATQIDQSPKTRNNKPSSMGLQKSSSMNKRGRKPAESVPVTPKAVPSESFEIVRAKMRESLAAALELVAEEQNKLKGESPRDANLNKDFKSTDKVPDGTQSSNRSSEATPNLQPEYSGETSGIAVQISDNASANQGLVNAGCDGLGFQQKSSLADDGSVNETILMKDEFLQENGLCWASFSGNEGIEVQEPRDSKRPKLTCDIVEEPSETKSQKLAREIEDGLFKLFGGVNKKYKEKGRSLLFNLKDRHNPELRQRVYSEEISPESLCRMSAEDLASKELSEWRIAKAEELAQMVVLPESDVNLRMVKKTHKGEFQVEVQDNDAASVEISMGTGLLPRFPIKNSGKNNAHSKASQKDSEVPNEGSNSSKKSVSQNKRGSYEQLPLYDLDSAQPENTDLMQYLMVEESKDADFLPPVPSLDEFMMELASEPPFVNLQDDAVPEPSISDDKSSDSLARHRQDVMDTSEIESKIKSEMITSPKLGASTTILKSKLNTGFQTSELSPDNDSAAPTNSHHAAFTNSMPSSYSTKKPSQIDTNFPSSDLILKQCLPSKDILVGELVWDGLIQLNISSLVTALGFYRSGEQVSMKDWPSFLEIKGRVRLDAFDKFLQELRISRSRAIMALHFCWKEGSPESGRMKLCETIDSYIVDERVGFSEPVAGLELYFCPPHPKTTQMLISNLSKEHEEFLSKIDNGLIGILIWKKEVSPRQPSQSRKHSRKHSLPRNSDDPNAHHTNLPHPSALPAAQNDDEEIDDVPPGFGPAAARSREDDDLPEFSFVQDSSKPDRPHIATAKIPPIPPLQPSRPVEQIREMILKYGSNENKQTSKDDDDDDDIPEWRPDLPSINPSPYPMQYQQPNLNPHQVGNHYPSLRPMYKTESQAPQYQQPVPAQWTGVPFTHHGFQGQPPAGPKYRGPPGGGRYPDNHRGWNLGSGRGR